MTREDLRIWVAKSVELFRVSSDLVHLNWKEEKLRPSITECASWRL